MTKEEYKQEIRKIVNERNLIYTVFCAVSIFGVYFQLQLYPDISENIDIMLISVCCVLIHNIVFMEVDGRLFHEYKQLIKELRELNERGNICEKEKTDDGQR